MQCCFLGTNIAPRNILLQGAGNCFTGLCEAIVSWRHVGCEGLHNELIQLMQVWVGDGFGPEGGTETCSGARPRLTLGMGRAFLPSAHLLPLCLQGYKAQLSGMGQWEAAMGSLNPAVQQKLAQMCQL